MKVLLVEDSKFQRTAIKLILEKLGIEVFEFEDADSALMGMAGLDVIHVVITDLNMPGRNGVELVKELRSQGFERPIFILTAEEDNKLKEEAEAIGVSGVIKKPINFDSQIDVIMKELIKQTRE